jgi:hypothetical protein
VQIYLLISYALIGVLCVALLVMSLISTETRHRSGEKLNALIFFTLAFVSLCVLVGLAATYISTGALSLK